MSSLNKNKFNGLIIYFGGYPIGSWANRVRMWRNGFMKNNIDTKLILPFPYRLAHYVDEPGVFYLQKPDSKLKKGLVYFFRYIRGVFKAYSYVKSYSNDIRFVLFAGGSFAECVLIEYYCRRKGIIFSLEVVDENSKKYSEQSLSIIDRIAAINKSLFDKYVVGKADVLFVLSSYLEEKYKNLFPKLKIRRSIPTLIDYAEYVENSKKDIFNLKDSEVAVFRTDKVKILYAGSCERTNGILFFLECATTLIKEKNYDIEIILIFHIGNSNKVENYIRELDIKKFVTILSAFSPEYMPAIYNHCDILFIPEHGSIIANAGFPGKVAEYLASGKAILTTIFSDIPKYLTHECNAMLAEVGDYKKYTRNLDRLICEKKLREKLGRNAVFTVKRYFDCKKGTQIYLEELYKEN